MQNSQRYAENQLKSVERDMKSSKTKCIKLKKQTQDSIVEEFDQ